MLLVIVIGTLESPAIRPGEDALSMHLVVLPLPFVPTAIRPCVDAFTLYHIMKFANVMRAVRPLEVATPFLLAHLVLTLIGAPVRPLLESVTMLLVLLPVTFIGSAIEMHVLAFALRFVVDPVAFIDISICVDEAAHAVGHVIEPVTIIPTAIQPDLDAAAFSHIGHGVPFSLVLGPVLKCGKLHEFSHEFLGISVIVLKRIQILKDLVDDGILELFTLL